MDMFIGLFTAIANLLVKILPDHKQLEVKRNIEERVKNDEKIDAWVDGVKPD